MSENVGMFYGQGLFGGFNRSTSETIRCWFLQRTYLTYIGSFHQWGYPQTDGLFFLSSLIMEDPINIWIIHGGTGYLHFRKPPILRIVSKNETDQDLHRSAQAEEKKNVDEQWMILVDAKWCCLKIWKKNT